MQILSRSLYLFEVKEEDHTEGTGQEDSVKSSNQVKQTAQNRVQWKAAVEAICSCQTEGD